jgi:UDP-N-acetylmuramate--alanine ligase
VSEVSGRVLSLKADGTKKHVHFVGIGGAGMSALARVLLDRGFSVSGSDVTANDAVRDLAGRGARVGIGHAAEHVLGADCVVFTTVVAPDNPELQAARAAGIPVLHRSELLAELMAAGKSIAIAGAHGKTTTTSMIAHALVALGYDPTFVVGGVVASLGVGARAGSGEWIVGEADESDGSFVNYRPEVAVVLNIEPDHLEYHGHDFENLKRAYAQFAQGIPAGGALITSADDPLAARLDAAPGVRHLTFALRAPTADLRATDISLSGHGVRATVWRGQTRLGDLELAVPGAHNVGNALAAIHVCCEVGPSFDRVAEALRTFRGALRRFQIHWDQSVRVVDDYAHHPTEIRANIELAAAAGRRLIAVFQPQRYTRTASLFDDFARAFRGADEVLIADIYSPAGEQPIAGVSAERLADAVRAQSNPRARYGGSVDDVSAYLKASVRPGDVVLTMGAGDIWRAAQELAAWLKSQGETASCSG